MKKLPHIRLSFIRTVLLLIILIFTVLGGRFLYTGMESAAPLDRAESTVRFQENLVLRQDFRPAYPLVTHIALALQPPGENGFFGSLTFTLTDLKNGNVIYTSTVLLAGAADRWYLDFPVNRRLDTLTDYGIDVTVSDCGADEFPSLYIMTAERGPEISGSLTEHTEYDSAIVPHDGQSMALRFTYDVPVPARIIAFAAVLVLILLFSAVSLLSRRRERKRRQDRAAGKSSAGVREETGLKDNAGLRDNAAGKNNAPQPGKPTAKKRPAPVTMGDFLKIPILGVPLIHILFFLAVTIAAVILRVAFLPVKSNDYYLCFESWITDMRSAGGLASLGKNIGDYPPLYMTLVTAASLLPFEPVIIIKLLPCLFDFILAFVCVRVAKGLGVADRPGLLTLYGVILLNPLTVLDSSAWGQCDSVYTSFILLALLMLCRGNPCRTAETGAAKKSFWCTGDGICLLFALAFCFKLQSVFFLPVICLVWIMQKKNLLRPVHLLWVPMAYTVSCIPMFLAGRSLKVMFKIYLGQADRNYGTLTLNYPNLYSLIGSWSETLYEGYFIYGLMLAFLLLLLLFYRLYCKKVELNSLTLCKVTALTVLIICYFLPLVHERYAYMAEMLLFIIMTKDTKHIKTALITMLCTLFTYCGYLYQLEGSFTVLPDWATALIRLGVIFYLTADILNAKTAIKKTP